MDYHTSCVFTVVFTACSLCVYCVFTANEFWAPPSSSSVCRGRRPSSSFVGRSVDPSVGRRRRPSLVVHRRRCRPSVGRSAPSTCPCLSRQTEVSSPLTYVVANHTNFLPAFFLVYLRIARPIVFCCVSPLYTRNPRRNEPPRTPARAALISQSRS